MWKGNVLLRKENQSYQKKENLLTFLHWTHKSTYTCPLLFWCSGQSGFSSKTDLFTNTGDHTTLPSCEDSINDSSSFTQSLSIFFISKSSCLVSLSSFFFFFFNFPPYSLFTENWLRGYHFTENNLSSPVIPPILNKINIFLCLFTSSAYCLGRIQYCRPLPY